MSTHPRQPDRAAAPEERQMPRNIEAEHGLLGSLLLDPERVLPLLEGQPAEIFYLPSSRTIFETAMDLRGKRQPVDIVTLPTALNAAKQLENIGGGPHLAALMNATPTSANAEAYLDAVLDCHARRRMIDTCEHYARWAREPMDDVELMQDALETEVLHLPRAGRVETRGADPRAGTLAALEEMEAIYDGRAEIVGIKLGLAPLDKMLGGVTPGQMIVIAARPSVGKSALALNFAESVAVDRKLPVGMFSLEMTEGQQRRRLIASRAGVNMEKVRERVVSEWEFARVSGAGNHIADAPLYIDDTRGLSIAELRARARRWHQRFGLRLLVVDYLQLLKSTSPQAKNSREREVSDVSEGLKSLAGELGIPVIALCQLNRDSERQKRKPMLSDLRESGSLEQDADVVLLLHRAEMQAQSDEDRAELAGEAELIVAKQREGPTGPVPLVFRKEFTRFEPMAREGQR